VAFVLFFFFQAEDGIRDLIVTGVQTCALPILKVDSSTSDTRPPPTARTRTVWLPSLKPRVSTRNVKLVWLALFTSPTAVHGPSRSEERRVGKECRAGGAAGRGEGRGGSRRSSG